MTLSLEPGREKGVPRRTFSYGKVSQGREKQRGENEAGKTMVFPTSFGGFLRGPSRAACYPTSAHGDLPEPMRALQRIVSDTGRGGGREWRGHGPEDRRCDGTRLGTIPSFTAPHLLVLLHHRNLVPDREETLEKEIVIIWSTRVRLEFGRGRGCKPWPFLLSFFDPSLLMGSLLISLFFFFFFRFLFFYPPRARLSSNPVFFFIPSTRSPTCSPGTVPFPQRLPLKFVRPRRVITARVLVATGRANHALS